MKVSEMIEALKNFPQDAYLVFQHVRDEDYWVSIGDMKKSVIYSNEKNTPGGDEEKGIYNYQSTQYEPYKYKIEVVKLYHEKQDEPLTAVDENIISP